MDILIGLLGVIFAIAVAYLFSNQKKNINYKAIGVLLVLQVIVTLFMLKTTIGTKIIEVVSNGVSKVISYGYEGIDFVVGGLIPEGVSVFFFNVLMVIIFTSTLLSILTYIKFLPLAIKYVGGFLAKITGLSKVVTFNSVNSIFFGQSEAILAIKTHLDNMSNNKLFIISTSAMASVSASIMGAYMTMIPPKFVLVSMLLNALSGLIVASMMAPIKEEEDENINIKDISTSNSLFGAIGDGALDGGKVALIVAAQLVAFVGLMALINGIFTALINISFTEILGYIFAPIAFIMGVPWSEAITAGSIMGTKLATNEFVAMLQLQPLVPDLSAKTVAIVSSFLVSFANFSSIGIIAGSIQAVHAEKASIVAKYGLKILLAATLASVLTGTVVGIFI
ncbi:NupC/NupG family nucleoside CNT transporter [Caldibacillus thermolactis]|jgi:nucleoside transport protein|uniref:NupC/NupG family nucleoside CNT transporter n=1 Tax=Pallidibacillus thermolactis TaxID=251051 RepID=A0ABT2WCI8_9BACI|nr:nucleoside transporter C-terminal domain-containing protein [Pallidibacillus thermolactis]MCU9593392.1 NupC/NupG family nucleoside CNT transporter [Pallidibacillus thermolactis]MCU9602048.1 NupC/NupG family nucleoside CNT transporter [Pallidibacillus thermolactis subsp. kokeshiiformis]MED1673741.1 nucleoside transporter C-terminal domain-containing protein [Pallidibacillus thermolactis subsp. kokeshiiformis]